MARFKNVETGVVVSVADEKAGRFGVEWEPFEAATEKPKKPAAKPAAKPSK